MLQRRHPCPARRDCHGLTTQPKRFCFYFSTNRCFVCLFVFVPIESLGVNRVLNWKLRPISSTCLTPSGSSGSATFAQKQHEFSQVRLGLLQHFDFLTKTSWGTSIDWRGFFVSLPNGLCNRLTDHWRHLPAPLGRDSHHLLDLVDVSTLSPGPFRTQTLGFLEKPTQNG